MDGFELGPTTPEQRPRKAKEVWAGEEDKKRAVTGKVSLPFYCDVCGKMARGEPWDSRAAMARAAPHALCCGALADAVICGACASSGAGGGGGGAEGGGSGWGSGGVRVRPEFFHDFCQRRGAGWGFECKSCGRTTFPGEIADEDRVRKLREMVGAVGAAGGGGAAATTATTSSSSFSTPSTIAADARLSYTWCLLELGKAESARGRHAEALRLLHTVEGLLKEEGHNEFIRKVEWMPWKWWAHPASFVVEEDVSSSSSSSSPSPDALRRHRMRRQYYRDTVLELGRLYDPSLQSPSSASSSSSSSSSSTGGGGSSSSSSSSSSRKRRKKKSNAATPKTSLQYSQLYNWEAGRCGAPCGDFNLACIYYEKSLAKASGSETSAAHTKDFRKALHYFFRAAASGLADACYNLGVLVFRKHNKKKKQQALSLFSRGVLLLSSVPSPPMAHLSTDFDDARHGDDGKVSPGFATSVLRERLIEMQGEMLLRGKQRNMVIPPTIICATCCTITQTFVPCMCCCRQSLSSSFSPSSSSLSSAPPASGPLDTSSATENWHQLSRCGLYYCNDVCRRAEGRQHVSPCPRCVAPESGVGAAAAAAGAGGAPPVSGGGEAQETVRAARDAREAGEGETVGGVAGKASFSESLLCSDAGMQSLDEAVHLWLTEIGLAQYL